MGAVAQSGERRLKHRFQIQRELRYRVLEGDYIVSAGEGTTVNISSAGVCFRSQADLRNGSFIELSISWPAMLDDTCRLRLTALGRVVWHEGRLAAATIERHEFRVQSRVGAPERRAGRCDATLRRWADSIRRLGMMRQPASS